ncbi:MAG: hypothetical protein JXR07_06690 [Reichenbachiella sp.]
MIKQISLSICFLCMAAQVYCQEDVQSQNERIKELQDELENLKYSELVQSMSQRSLLIPGYFPELKALVAAQAHQFWTKKSHEVYVSHLNIYSSLHYGNKYLGYDSLLELHYNQIKGHDALVVSIEFGHDPNVFFSAGSDGKILKWDLKNLKNPPVVLYKNREIFRSIEISYDDNWMLATTKDHGVVIIDLHATQASLSSEVPAPSYTRDPEKVQAAKFLPGQLKYLTITKAGDVKMKGYGLDSTKTRTNAKIKVIEIDGKNNDVYAGTGKGVVQIWNENFEERYLDLPELYAINALAISANQRYIAIGREKGDAIIWDMIDKKLVRTISGHQSAITDLDFSPDDKLLLTASRDGTARIWDINESKRLPIILDDHEGWVMTACFDRSGSKILTGSRDKKIRVWPLDPKELEERICEHVERNLTEEEWNEYVGQEIEYAETCVLQE